MNIFTSKDSLESKLKLLTLLRLVNKNCAQFELKITDPTLIEQFSSPVWFWKHFKETMTDASSSAFSYFQ